MITIAELFDSNMLIASAAKKWKCQREIADAFAIGNARGIAVGGRVRIWEFTFHHILVTSTETQCLTMRSAHFS